MLLNIFIITYNRSIHLAQTLEYLSRSKFRYFKTVVLNNASTDNTAEVVEQYRSRFECISLITHKNNIGAGANVMRAMELSEADYTWVLCDDDKLNLAEVDDLLEILEQGEVDLVHVGAHDEINWKYGGTKMTPENLISGGYHYFKAGSFLPCNIFRTGKFQSFFLIPGYNNIVNGYPQMPFLGNIYLEGRLIYLTKLPLVNAVLGNQSYNYESWFFWWLNTSKIMGTPSAVQAFFFDHFSDPALNKKFVFHTMREFYFKNNTNRFLIKSFVEEFFTKEDRILFNRGIIKRKVRVVLSRMRRGFPKSK